MEVVGRIQITTTYKTFKEIIPGPPPVTTIKWIQEKQASLVTQIANDAITVRSDAVLSVHGTGMNLQAQAPQGSIHFVDEGRHACTASQVPVIISDIK